LEEKAEQLINSRNGIAEQDEAPRFVLMPW
jgi:hypothetical protein